MTRNAHGLRRILAVKCPRVAIAARHALFHVLVATAIVALFAPAATATPQLVIVLHRFAGTDDGANPLAALIQATDGNFYGTTASGVADCAGFSFFGCGTAFKMTPGGTLTILHAFNGIDGSGPQAALLQAADGNFYGTTASGGPAGVSGFGTVFTMTPSGTVTTLHAFAGGTDGAASVAGLIQATDGNFYGTTARGGGITTAPCGAGGCGTVFKMTSDGSVTTLHAFTGGTDGWGPAAALLQAADGNFYGTTASGGTIFKMTPDGTLTTLHQFTGPDGIRSAAALVQATDGNFYGTTSSGGPYGYGTAFEMTPSGTVTTLHAFTGGTDGRTPQAALLQAAHGNFYGTTSAGGPGTNGTVFKMTPDGTVTNLHAFTSGNFGDASDPVAALIQATDGSFYGTTFSGGTHASSGAVFKLTNVADRDDVVADFGSAYGVWLRPTFIPTWRQLHSLSAKNIVTGDLDGSGQDEVIIDFGPGYGIWVHYNDSNWVQLHASTANRMVTGDLDGNGKAEVLIDFPGVGIWVWANNASWFQLHASNSNNIVTADLDGNGKQEAIVDFQGFGIWVWLNNASWFQLHPLNSRLMTAGDFNGNGQDDLIVDFPGYGLWKYADNTSWSQVHAFDASHVAAADVDGNGKSDLIVDFGNPYGIWMLLNGTTWSQLHPQTSTNIVVGDVDSNGKADVIVNFGAAGLWEYANNTNWTELHTMSPGVIAVGHIELP